MEQTARHTFDAPIDKVWAMFTDPDAHLAKFEAMGHRDIELVSSDLTDGKFHIVVTRLVDTELPGFAKKVFSPTNTVTSRDEWRRDDDGSISGDWELETVGAPIQIRGKTALHERDGKTDYVIDVTLKVKVPLIGGKMENFSKDVMAKQIELEFSAGDAWLSSHP